MSGGGIIVANTASILGMATETQFVSESDIIPASSNFTLWNVTAVAKNNKQTNKQRKLFTKERTTARKIIAKKSYFQSNRPANKIY